MDNAQYIYNAVDKVVKYGTDSYGDDDIKDLKEGQEQVAKIIELAGKENGGGTCEKAACLGAVCKLIVKRLKKGSKGDPNAEKALEICEKTLEGLCDSWEVYGYAAALAAAETNPVAAISAAWAGPAIAKKGIDWIRYVAPSLDTDEKTKEIENKVFTNVGGGAGVGAAVGGVIGFLFGGPPGAAAGAALGGSFGGAGGAIKHAVEN